MKGRRITWSAEELWFLEEFAWLPRELLHAAFVRWTGRTDVSVSNVSALCKRRGWKTGRTGRFEKGQAPANKGKKIGSHPNSKRTQFKPGDRKGRANENYKPIGTERMAKDGYLERKVHDGMPLQSRWRAVHLIRWEETNGPVPEGHCLKCLDGDRTNTDPENWIAVPRALMPRLAGRWTMPYDEAPKELKPTLLALARVSHAARERRNAD